MECPPPIRVGDLIRVVGPSGPFDDELLRAGLARLDRYEVLVPADLWGRRAGFFAGSDEARLRELKEALDDPSAKAVLVARGGYGLQRLLPHLDFEQFKKRPKWVIGFSDVTTLHLALGQRGFVSLHAQNGTTLARSSDAEVSELCQLLEGEQSQTFTGLGTIAGGAAEGPLFGGNLTVLFAEAASGRLHLPAGALLFLEDVTETSYRVDRMLTSLIDGGHLSQVAGVVIGEFFDCSPGKFEVPVLDVLEERLRSLRVPVVHGFPCGHGAVNRPLLLGAYGRLTPGPAGAELVLRVDASTY